MLTWERRRRPDEVPTPVAVALSDHCRRARSPATAAEVRDALSVLSPEDDFRVTLAAEAEPELSPLSPFAAVDLVRGVEPPLVRKRQDSGYYDLVRNLLALRDEKVVEVQVPVVVERAAPAAVSAPAPAAAAKSKKVLSVEERIAPKKRPARTAAETSAAPAPAPAEPQLLPFQERKLNLPRPRGRFTRVGAARAKFDTLFHTSFKADLVALLEQAQNRVQLLRVLSESHSGRRGLDLTAGNVQEAVTHHGLSEALATSERTQVLAAFAEHRGAAGRVARSLGLTDDGLEEIIRGAGMAREVEEIRERFRQELLDGRNLSVRLEHAGRDKYLEDLDIKQRFVRELSGELRRMFLETAAGKETLETATESVARKYGTAPDLLGRALMKLGLTGELTEWLAGGPPPTP
jgi:hypothetical protein